MYLGKIVEMAETEELLRNPLHPYTRALRGFPPWRSLRCPLHPYTRALRSGAPAPDPTYRRDRPDIRGDLTLPIDPPPRCRFYDRCPVAADYWRDNPHPPME